MQHAMPYVLGAGRFDSRRSAGILPPSMGRGSCPPQRSFRRFYAIYGGPMAVRRARVPKGRRRAPS